MLSSGRRGETHKTQEINEIHEVKEIHVSSKGHRYLPKVTGLVRVCWEEETLVETPRG